MANPVTDTINGATGTLQSNLLAVGGTGLGIGAVIYAVRKGWSFFRSMV
jgi:predicted membrane channel-forming protein YqfA (hemolysin III family)